MAVDPSVVEEKDSRDGRRMCDLYIGTTGSGKSTYCKARAVEEDKHLFVPKSGARAGSKKPVMGWASAKRMRLLDTQGFLDTGGKKESVIRMELWQAIFDAGVDFVRVVWCVFSNERATAELQKQAAFITSLLPKGKDLKEFWAKNVLIVIKDTLMSEIRKYKSGPVQAAVRSGADEARLKLCAVRTLESVEDEDLRETFNGWSNAKRMRKGMVRQSELATFEEAVLLEVGYCRLVKRDDCCVNCGMKGDMRLWPQNCHSGPFEGRHTGKYAGYGNDIKEKGDEIMEGTSAAVGAAGACAGGAVGGAIGAGLAAGKKHVARAGVAAGGVVGGALGMVVGVGTGAVVSGGVVAVATVLDHVTATWSCCKGKRMSCPCATVCATCGAKKRKRNKKTDTDCKASHDC